MIARDVAVMGDRHVDPGTQHTEREGQREGEGVRDTYTTQHPTHTTTPRGSEEERDKNTPHPS